MLNRIVLLLVVFSMVITAPGNAGADVGGDDDMDLEGPIVFVCAAYIGASLFLMMYNCSRLEADDPSKLGGAGGIVVGTFTFLGGVAIIYPHPAARVAGVACMAAGGYTVYCGVKSLKAVRRKYIEAEEQGLVFEPILIDDGSGRPGPGLQVSWTFRNGMLSAIV